MKTNLIKTELTLAQILNHQLNWGYQPNAKDLDNLCPIIHLSKLEIDQEDNQPLDQYQLGMLEYITPHIAINALMGYLGTYNYYYSWYNFIHNTYDNDFTGYVPIPGKENPFIALEEYLREPKPEILVYYNTDEEYFTFNRLQDEPMADTSMAEDTYIFDGVTFYIFKD